MKMRVLFCVLASAITVDASAGIISRTCNASVSAGIPMGGGGGGGHSDTVSAPPCNADTSFSGSGLDGTGFGTVSTEYSGEIENHYRSIVDSFDSGFTLKTAMYGEGTITVEGYYILPGFPDAIGGPAIGGVLAFGSSLDTFSVDDFYNFSLNLDALGTVGISQNFLGALGNTSLISFSQGTTGILTGLLRPGETYSIAMSNNEQVGAGVLANTGPKTSSREWGGQMASLTAVAVPEPGTVSIMLAGMLGLFAMSCMRRRKARA